MSRPPLPIGTWGNISTRVEKTDAKGKPVTYLAKARIRDHDGCVRPVTAVGRTKTAAERRLLQQLQDRARTCRAVLSGATSLAVRYGAASVNPVREVEKPNPKTSPEPSPPRSPTPSPASRRGPPPQDHQIQSRPTRPQPSQLGHRSPTHEASRRQSPRRPDLRRRPRQLPRPLQHPPCPPHRLSLSPPVGSTARRDLGLTLRRKAGLTRKQVAAAHSWPQTRIELIETGRIKVDRQLLDELVKTYGINLEDSSNPRAEIEAAAQPAESDKLACIRSHALRKTTATALSTRVRYPISLPDSSAGP